MKVNSVQVSQARAAVAHYPVTANFGTQTGDEWYTRAMMDQYPNGVPVVNPFPLLLGQISAPVKSPDAIYRLVVLAASRVTTPVDHQAVIPTAAGALPDDYQEVLMRQGPYAAIPVDNVARPEQELVSLAMFCFIYMRAIVKDEAYMARMPEKARNIIRGVYGYECAYQALMDPLQLKGFKEFIRMKDPVVMGIIRGAVESENQAKGVGTVQAKRAVQVLNAGLLLNIRYYGYGCLTMFLRMNQRVEADINRMLEGFAGTAYAPALVSVLFVMIVYMEEDHGRRQLMIDAFGIVGAPDPGQVGWQYGRVFKEDCMSIIASKTHDTFISLCLNIYNKLNPENQIRNYRPLSPGVSKAAEEAFAEAFQKHFASGLVGQEKGFLGLTAESLMNLPPTAPAQMPHPAAPAAVAAAPAIAMDEDI